MAVGKDALGFIATPSIEDFSSIMSLKRISLLSGRPVEIVLDPAIGTHACQCSGDRDQE